MKDRVALYVHPPEDQDISVKFRLGGGKEPVLCLKKKYVDKKRDGAGIIGYVHRRNRDYSGKEYAVLKGALRDDLDIYSRKKLYQRVIAYIPTADGEYLGVTGNRWLVMLLFFGCLIGGALALWFTVLRGIGDKNPGVLTPDFSRAADEESGEDDSDDSAVERHVIITLPDGKVEFDDGDIVSEEEDTAGGDDEKEPYTGRATVRVTLQSDGAEHTVLPETEVDIQNGELPDLYLDFTKLDFELKPGVYDGFVYLTYADGATDAEPIRVVIRSSESGKAGIGYSDQLYVDLAEEKITLKYICQESTADTIIQLIIQSGDEELLLAESGLVHSGDSVLELPLDSSAKERLLEGAYKGVMRVWFEDAAVEAAGTERIKADIEVTFNVQ